MSPSLKWVSVGGSQVPEEYLKCLPESQSHATSHNARAVIPRSSTACSPSQTRGRIPMLERIQTKLSTKEMLNSDAVDKSRPLGVQGGLEGSRVHERPCILIWIMACRGTCTVKVPLSPIMFPNSALLVPYPSLGPVVRCHHDTHPSRPGPCLPFDEGGLTQCSPPM